MILHKLASLLRDTVTCVQRHAQVDVDVEDQGRPPKPSLDHLEWFDGVA